MFSNKEMKLFGGGYFTIIRIEENYIEMVSNNTRHQWIIFKRSIDLNKPVTLYHKHTADRPDYKVEKVVDGYTGFLFLDKDGMPLVAMHWEHRFNHMVSRYNEIYKVQMPNITPHVCRHTYCSNMAKSGMNPKTLQYLMGHSDIAVTLNVYTHVGLEDAEKELQKMQGLENARKEMGISDTDDKPLKQNMFKVV